MISYYSFIMLVFISISITNVNAGSNKWYYGHLPTPAEWEADLIFNGNFPRFCQSHGAKYVAGGATAQYWTGTDRGGVFAKDWYYAGPRYCANDTLIAVKEGPSNELNPATMWKYNGGCGATVHTHGWTYALRGLIVCDCC
jgi:hypothetical protein